MNFREEKMSESFTKYHIEGLPLAAVLHKFTAPDQGPPHDHPWGFTSFVVSGGYREKIYRLDRTPYIVDRTPGQSFFVEATRIHQITRLFGQECWTLIIPGPWERVSRFWDFREDGAYSRAWNESDWAKSK